MELSCLQSSGVIQTVGGLQNTAQRLVSSQQHFRSKLVDRLLEDAAVLSGNDTKQEEKEADALGKGDYAPLKYLHGVRGHDVKISKHCVIIGLARGLSV